MELEDLRKNWLKPPPEPAAPINPVQLESLLANRPGLVDKMRRNAWWETAFAALFTLSAPLLWLAGTATVYKIYTVIMLLVGCGMLYYYYRIFAVLNRMRLVEGDVRGHLQRLAAGMRTLLRFYYRLTLATGPVLMCLNFGYFLGRELGRYRLVGNAPFRWDLLMEMAAVSVVAGLLLQVAAVYGTRWFMQRLYGQHLDRLERSLQELNEASAI